ncbi:hypothetical protein C8R47DRAFT_1116707 [Mycena vitilis]|nr:hypothetical protein C8R47DRAFT_1116707 [Mycena vitilis]
MTDYIQTVGCTQVRITIQGPTLLGRCLRGNNFPKQQIRGARHASRREASEQLSIPDLLGTTKGLWALATFLEKTGAFTKTGRPRIETAATPMDDDEDDEEEGSEGGYGGDEESGEEGAEDD